MNLEDLDGARIDLASKPKLTDLGTFEGIVEYKFYRDAIAYAGECEHCKSVVSGVLRFEDPKMQKHIRSLHEELHLKREVARLMRQNHQCSWNAEGKTDIDDWFKNMGMA